MEPVFVFSTSYVFGPHGAGIRNRVAGLPNSCFIGRAQAICAYYAWDHNFERGWARGATYDSRVYVQSKDLSVLSTNVQKPIPGILNTMLFVWCYISPSYTTNSYVVLDGDEFAQEQALRSVRMGPAAPLVGNVSPYYEMEWPFRSKLVATPEF